MRDNNGLMIEEQCSEVLHVVRRHFASWNAFNIRRRPALLHLYDLIEYSLPLLIDLLQFVVIRTNRE